MSNQDKAQGQAPPEDKDPEFQQMLEEMEKEERLVKKKFKPKFVKKPYVKADPSKVDFHLQKNGTPSLTLKEPLIKPGLTAFYTDMTTVGASGQVESRFMIGFGYEADHQKMRSAYKREHGIPDGTPGYFMDVYPAGDLQNTITPYQINPAMQDEWLRENLHAMAAFLEGNKQKARELIGGHPRVEGVCYLVTARLRRMRQEVPSFG